MGARQQYANTDNLNFLRTDSGIPYSRSWPRPQIHLSHSTNSVEQYSPKILRDDVTVQLIVSCAAIRDYRKNSSGQTFRKGSASAEPLSPLRLSFRAVRSRAWARPTYVSWHTKCPPTPMSCDCK